MFYLSVVFKHIQENITVLRIRMMLAFVGSTKLFYSFFRADGDSMPRSNNQLCHKYRVRDIVIMSVVYI